MQYSVVIADQGCSTEMVKSTSEGMSLYDAISFKKKKAEASRATRRFGGE